jgi:peptidoglycan/LPS O-acetylase OafA/YrhL
MNIRKLKIQPDENLDNFKITLLKSLHLLDANKNCLLDFEDRIDNYFKRNKTLQVEIEIDVTKLSDKIYDNQFWNLKDYKQEIPENYPIYGSNMETQNYVNPIIVDDKFRENQEKIKKETELLVDSILAELKKLNTKENIEIKLIGGKFKTETLKPKQHFEILDGLRGVAALAIVFFHFMEIVYPPQENFIAHGFLAVDFFFCLSGFVIAYAYHDRIGKMKLTDFFALRLIRLHPLVVFGSVLGLLAFLFDPFGGHPETYETGRLILIFLASVFLIPFPVMADRYFNLFGLNAPGWSLFWEYVANILYALFLYKLGRRSLFLLTVLAGAGICFASHRAGGSLVGGWSGETFWDGFARISYSFLAGMLIYRSNWIIKSKLGFIALSVLLLFTFFIPFSDYNWLTEPLVVLLYFPLLIILGAGATLKPIFRKLCVFFGKISYPLYMTHYAAMWIFANYYTKYKPETCQLALIMFAGTLFLLGIAYLTMVFYDIPIRKYLTDRRKKI